jgi:hypothetical protein
MRLRRADLLAAATAGVVCLAASAWDVVGGTRVSEDDARVEAAMYLTAAPTQTQLEDARWRVSDGRDTAWIDARSGELVEIAFEPVDTPTRQ